MKAKALKPNLRSEKIQSALLWIISGLYLLTMVWVDTAERKSNSGWCQRLSCSLFHMAFSCCGFGRMKRLHPREGKSGAFHDRPDNSQDR